MNAKIEQAIIKFRDTVYEAAGGDNLSDEAWHKLKDAFIEYEKQVLELAGIKW